MKKLLLFFILNIVLPLSLYSQNKQEEWDEQTSIYKNFKYDFSWILNRQLTWIKQPLLQRNAIFGAVSPETNAVAYITVDSANVGSDIWKYYTEEKNNTLKALKNSPMDMQLISFDKCNFAGKNAIMMKTICTYKNDIRQPMQQYFETTTFLVYNNNNMFSISIMIDKELSEIFKEEKLDVKDVFFNGWLFDAE